MKAGVPIEDIIGFPWLIGRSLREHRASGSRLRDIRLLATLKTREPAGRDGPLMISLTQYTPHHLRDLAGIWQAADRLGDQLVEIDGAYGVVTYLQPGQRRVGSLSVWTKEAGLAQFVGLPYHREIMARYRDRGLPLRSAKWWSQELHLGPAMAEGQRLLEGSVDRRVVVKPLPSSR